MIDLRKLIKNGVHFGHQTSRWSPKMKPYIWGFKNNIHLIDVSKTAYQLEKAAKFLKEIAAKGKPILWVGTKKAAQGIIYKIAKELNLPYVIHRWVGGTFSNYRQVRKSVANLLHYEDIIAKSDQYHYSKKELNVFQKKVDRLQNSIGGIRNLTWPVGAVVVVDVKKEHVCVKEAKVAGIPVVALVDTNCDPSSVDYVIPANDDAPRSISILLDYLQEAVKQGLEAADLAQKEEMEDASAGVFETVFEDVSEEDEEAEAKKKRGQQTRPIKKAKVVKRTSKKEGDIEGDEEQLEKVIKAKVKDKPKEIATEEKEESFE